MIFWKNRMSTEEIKAEQESLLQEAVRWGHACLMVHTGASQRYWELDRELQRRAERDRSV